MWLLTDAHSLHRVMPSDYYSFKGSLKIKYTDFDNFVFPFKIVLTIIGHLPFYVNFKTSLYIYNKKACLGFD